MNYHQTVEVTTKDGRSFYGVAKIEGKPRIGLIVNENEEVGRLHRIDWNEMRKISCKEGKKGIPIYFSIDPLNEFLRKGLDPIEPRNRQIQLYPIPDGSYEVRIIFTDERYPNPH